MDFAQAIRDVVGGMNAAGIRYALIGGFAMALRGIQRATVDLDFILVLEDLDRADALLASHGYRCVYRSENVSHFSADDPALGRIDMLHAFRRPSLGMLSRAEPIEVDPGVIIQVAQTEDLIGLKIQALCNDPERVERDWLDIRMLIRNARETGKALDWELIADYLRLFKLEHRLDELRAGHGTAH